MDELKPCPFCGSTSLKVDSKRGNNTRYINGEREEYHVVTVRCKKCHTRGPTVSVFLPWRKCNAAEIMNDAAIEEWNRRAEDANQTKT